MAELNFSSFLFGNVNERGELDLEDLDQETKGHLTAISGSHLGASLFSLEGIEIEKDADDQEVEPVVSLKSKDAVNFEEIEELAEDMSEQQQEKYIAKVLQLKKEKEKDMDDYDADETPDIKMKDSKSAGAHKDADRATSASATDLKKEKEEEEAKKKKMQANKPMRINLQALLKNATTLTPELKRICSTLHGPGGEPILKFSELFAPKKDDPVLKKPQRKPKNEISDIIDKSRVENDIDEEELFEAIQVTVPIYVQHEDDSQKREENSAVPSSTSEDKELELSTEIPLQVLCPVQQIPWEEQIIWDPEKEAKENSNPFRIKKKLEITAEEKETFVPFSLDPESPREETKSAWGTFVEEAPLSQQVSPNGDQQKESVKPTENGRETLNGESSSVPNVTDPQVDEATGTPSDVKPVVKEEKKEPFWSIFSTINDDIESGKWVEKIAWDSQSAHDKQSGLLIDLNDEYMYFEEIRKEKETEVVEQKDQKKKSSKSRKALLEEIENAMESEEEEEETDPFKLACNDKFYPSSNKKKNKQKVGKPVILHSLPALKLSLVRTHLTEEDLKNFHRPHIKIIPGQKFKIAPLKKERLQAKKPTPANRVDVMRHKTDLSGKDGRLVLMEYMDENPPLLMNVGMATRVFNFYRKKSHADTPNLNNEDGETVMLEGGDDSPFIGDVEPGKCIQALDNNMFRSPIHRHASNQTDFLLVRSKDGKKFYIREMPATYTVGQVQPLMEVPAPNSRVANNFIKSRLQAYIYRQFKKKTNIQQRLRISDICQAFPHLSETSIRKRLKDCADFQRGGDDSGWWTVKEGFGLPDEDGLRALVTPELVCSYESMLAGQFRLNNLGIKRLVSPSQIASIMAQIEEFEEIGETLRKSVSSLEEELTLTPWNTTSSFIAASQGKGNVQYTGLAEAVGKEAAGFLPQKVPQAKAKPPAQPRTTVRGTDADLRKLSLENARLVLTKFGVSEEVIQQLTRWDMIALVRKKSSEAAAAGDDAALTKFARGSRYSARHQQQQYKEQCQKIFDQQLQSIASIQPESSSESEDSDAENFEKDLESEMLKSSNFSRRGGEDDDEEEERAEFKKLMEEELEDARKAKVPLSSSGAGMGGSLRDEGRPGEKRKYVKRTFTTRNPDGTEETHVEIVKDPALVESYLKRLKVEPRKVRQQLTAEEEEQRNKVRKERRRLQEQLRRLKKNKAKQQTLREKMMKGELDESTVTSLKCGVCGLPGHMRTNRNCPYYSEERERERERRERKGKEKVDKDGPAASPRINLKIDKKNNNGPTVVDDDNSKEGDAKVKIAGTKIRIPKDILASPSTTPSSPNPTPTPSPAAKPLILKIKKDVLPSPSPSPSTPSTPSSSGSKKKRKEMEGGEEGEIDDTNSKKAKIARRRRNGTSNLVDLSNQLLKIWRKMREHPHSFPFQRAVQVKEAPDYYNIITNPVDLSMIREKISGMKYMRVEEFVNDVELMASNCHLYNKNRNPHLPPMADTLFEIAKEAYVMGENDDSFLTSSEQINILSPSQDMERKRKRDDGLDSLQLPSLEEEQEELDDLSDLSSALERKNGINGEEDDDDVEEDIFVGGVGDASVSRDAEEEDDGDLIDEGDDQSESLGADGGGNGLDDDDDGDDELVDITGDDD